MDVSTFWSMFLVSIQYWLQVIKHSIAILKTEAICYDIILSDYL